MIRAKDYQEANRTYRLGALRDTFLLCTSEVSRELHEERSAKL